LPIPPRLQAQFEAHLVKRGIPNEVHGVYKKWLRYYLDFCQKYRFPPTHKESLPQFIQKLQEKKQTNAQQSQATNAIKIYYDTLLAKSPSNPEPLIQPRGLQRYGAFHDLERFSVREPTARHPQVRSGTTPVSSILPISGPVRNLPGVTPSPEKKSAERAIGASWKAEYAGLVDEIKVRHYSPKTLQTYIGGGFRIFRPSCVARLRSRSQRMMSRSS